MKNGGIMKKSNFLLFSASLCFCFFVQAAPQSKIENEILDVLGRQKVAWNNKDIEGFMAYYWKSGDFVFQSGNNRVRGWQALLDRYKKSYSGENWGSLDFTDLEVKVLAADSVYVMGRWKVAAGEDLKEGLFTIILRRFPEGWLIIHDHTS
jgi:beta-aspartyl-peptidase (threonine type)